MQRSEIEGDPNIHAGSVIETVDICQARYLGRANPFTHTFNPFLNAIIGGRGTGKSTVVELLRIVLRRQGELPAELRQEFEKYGQVYPNREESGLLTEEAVISTIYRKNGYRFRLRWSAAKDDELIEQEINGEWHPVEGDIPQRFPVRIYSQKQVFQLANAPLALLNVVDEAPEVDRRSWSDKLKLEENRFLSLRAQIREIEAGFVEEPRLRGELDDVTQTLALFEREGHAEILKSFQERKLQEQGVEAWEKSWIDAGSRLREVATGIVPVRLDEDSFKTESASDKELAAYAIQVRDRLSEIRRNVQILASQGDEIVAEWQQNRGVHWQQSVIDATRAYEALSEKLAQEGAGDPTAYARIVEHRRGIELQLRELVEGREKVYELEKSSEECLRNLAEIRRGLTSARRTFLDKVLSNNRHVRISVIPYGATETVEKDLRSILQKEDGHFEKDIGVPGGEGLLGKLYQDGKETNDVERKLSWLKDKVKNIALNQYDGPPVADRRFVTHVRRLQPEAIDRLELWFPEDSLEVEYSTTGDGQSFRPIREGSPGQKTAALLAFLLSYGEEPLILDQPEDDLDNHLIYDLIVTQLREVKRHRQVIVITHNANLVVNGDAELVVALAPHSGETPKECEGSLQEKSVRETICEILEGGRKAFDDRYRRIALE